MKSVSPGDRRTTSVMRHLLILALLSPAVMPLAGCRICAECNDLDYPAYGGAWQRTRRDGGRVGSLFDPAGAKASELVDRDHPESPDALQRQRGETKPESSEPAEELSTPPAQDESEYLEQRTKDLREQNLDDIREDQEEQLRQRTLDDIDVRIVPGAPGPPSV